nr:glycosyltransferase family 39 protein [candidate division Zixibacteria bacterium]
MIKNHPLLFCMMVAGILRLVAVGYSRGFMANDDHFETVQIAYDGLQRGLINEEGVIRWNAMKGTDVGRSPLYTMFNYSMMYVLKAIGVEQLDSMMYFIRLAHALLSMLMVYFGFKYVHCVTGSDTAALVTGLIIGGYFLMPYLAVRNLVEMVSGDLLVPCLFLAYVGVKENNGQYLVLSGILGVLCWMIRFNTGLAVLPVPLAIWFMARNIRPAVYFCAGCVMMLVFAASLDIIYQGSFGRSTINIFNSFLHVTKNPPLPHPFYTFAGLILGIFIPPFSLYFIFSLFRKKVILDNIIVFSAAASFFLIHSAIAHKEERFMIPIFPLIVILGVIGLHNWLGSGHCRPLNRRIFKISAGLALAINLILLPLFTLNYAHKGMVEPFVYLGHQKNINNILVDRTERKRYIAISYAGFKRPRYFKIDSWPELTRIYENMFTADQPDYFVIFTDDSLADHLDSLSRYYGPVEAVFNSTPSLVDRILHLLNPKHNHLNESWVYRRVNNFES